MRISDWSSDVCSSDLDLLIVPANASAVGDHLAVEDIMGLSRCDALMIYVARPRTGKNRVVVDIGIHGLVPVWHREYRPCLIDRVQIGRASCRERVCQYV